MVNERLRGALVAGACTEEALAEELGVDPKTVQRWVLTGRVPADGPDVTTPPPVGPLAPWVGAGACALDAAVHAWDIAVATGQPSPLTPELATELHEAAVQFVEPLRGFAYAPALPAVEGDGPVEALLRYHGRSPSWTP